MKSRLPIALTLAAGLGTAAVFATIGAQAQQPRTGGQAAEEHMDRGMRWMDRMTPEDRSAFLDARLAALHAGLKLDADQEKLWGPVEAAVRDAVTQTMDWRQRSGSQERPADPVARLRRLAEATTARGQAFTKLADAAEPLYATLNDDQKRRLPMLLRAVRPMEMGPMARMMHRWQDWGHHGMGGEGRDGQREPYDSEE